MYNSLRLEAQPLFAEVAEKKNWAAKNPFL